MPLTSTSRRLWLLMALLLIVVASSSKTLDHVVADSDDDDDDDLMSGFHEQGDYLCSNFDGQCFEGDAQHDLLAAELEYYPTLAGDCRDLRDACAQWATQGNCTENPSYMHAYCRHSCQTCHLMARTVRRPSRAPLKRRYTQRYTALGSDIGVPQVINNRTDARAVSTRIRQAQDYIRDVVMIDDLYLMVRAKCRNTHPLCAAWAVAGQCEDNYDYMWDHCAPVCYCCEELHYLSRCPVDQNQKHAWYPGDLHRTFERIVGDASITSRYELTILSRPSYAEGDSAETADYQIGPWVITLDNFTSEVECQALIDSGHAFGLERSQDVGDELEDGMWANAVNESDLEAQGTSGLPCSLTHHFCFLGEVTGVVSTGRTSTNAWCDEEICEAKPEVEAVLQRMEALTGIHRNYSESLQLLRYEPGQFYERYVWNLVWSVLLETMIRSFSCFVSSDSRNLCCSHHDYIEIDRMRYSGSRILTVFMYMNDVEAGGGTNFPDLNLTVMPRRGRVLLWPSVLDDDPHAKDFRTDHQALPVEAGIKYGAVR